MDSTADTVGLQTKIDISDATTVDVILVQYIVQTFVKIVQIEQDSSSPGLHANLNLIDVSANLHIHVHT